MTKESIRNGEDASLSVVYVLPDKLGGVFSFVSNLLAHRTRGRQSVVLTRNRLDADALSDAPLPADSCTVVHHQLPAENLYAALRRVAAAVPQGRGVLVANDWIELAAETAYPSGRAVINVTHGDYEYYYNLATRHESTIDCFVCYTKIVEARLRELLPRRSADIRCVPYGVEIPATPRAAADGPLRLLFVGRLDEQKGVFDLPLIDAELRRLGVDVSWTIQGAGPAEAALRDAWPREATVVWRGRTTAEDVLALYRRHDVLVLPSRAEGLPVVLLEAGAAGVVPVISDLPSGIPEVVTNHETGFRVKVGDTTAFARAISELARDRSALERMSRGVRDLVSGKFDAVSRAAQYEALYAEYASKERPKRRGARSSFGSRLDHPAIPNPVVRLIRGGRLIANRMGLSLGGVLR